MTPNSAGAGSRHPAYRLFLCLLTVPLDAAANVAVLTDSTGGSTDGTLEAVSGSGADAAVNNNFAELNTQINSVLTALKNANLMATS